MRQLPTLLDLELLLDVAHKNCTFGYSMNSVVPEYVLYHTLKLSPIHKFFNVTVHNGRESRFCGDGIGTLACCYVSRR